MAWDLSRRRLLQTGSVAAVAIAAPYVRRANAAGRLAVGFWDHWVPGANDTCTRLCEEWAKAENVELNIDYITSIGQKNLLTIQAEAQAQSGHDILSFPTWEPSSHSDNLEPVDDLMKELTAQNGEVNEVVQYLGRAEGSWVAVPQTPGSQIKGPCGRIDYLKDMAGLDVRAMYPAGEKANEELTKDWTWEKLIEVAEQCKTAGKPVGIGLGTTSDSVDADWFLVQRLRC